MASAYPGPTMTMRTPASAGPRSCIDPTDIPRSAFASCRRSALTVIGVSPVDAGLKNAVAVPANACRTISSQICAVCDRSNAAVVAWMPIRTTSAVSITPRRGNRSPNTPPTSRKITSGAALAASTRPRSRADPVRSSPAPASANGPAPSQSSDTVCPMKNSRTSRSRSGPSGTRRTEFPFLSRCVSNHPESEVTARPSGPGRRIRVTRRPRRRADDERGQNAEIAGHEFGRVPAFETVICTCKDFDPQEFGWDRMAERKGALVDWRNWVVPAEERKGRDSNPRQRWVRVVVDECGYEFPLGFVGGEYGKPESLERPWEARRHYLLSCDG